MERILSIGAWGAGKTNGWVNVAEWSKRRQSEATFHIIDLDHTTERSLEAKELNVKVYEPYDWDELTDAIKTAKANSSRVNNDWLVIDAAPAIWDMAQAGFTDKIFGKDIETWFVEFRKTHQSGNPFQGDYGINWQVINKMYHRLMGQLGTWPGHVYACAPVEPVNMGTPQKAGDPEPVRNLFGRYGVKPKGQKDLPYLFHSILLMAEAGADQWKITTVRDRNRERLVGEPVSNFALDYLVKVGGWQL